MNGLVKIVLLFTISVILSSCIFDDDEEEEKWNAEAVCPAEGMNAYGMPNRGTFTDERDGQVYRYTTIGNQVWMAQNLNYDVENDQCYYEEDDCRTMGRVYYPTERPCPAGWHVPTEEEWHKLFDLFENTSHASVSLRANYSWAALNPDDNLDGTDECGLSVVFAINGRNTDSFESGYLTSSFPSDCRVKTLVFASYGRGIMWNENDCFYSSQYIRCVKD